MSDSKPDFVYEDAIAELENIVNSLNNGNVSLDDSLKLYSRGVELASICSKKINEVEKKIAMINRDTEEETTFDDKGEDDV